MNKILACLLVVFGDALLARPAPVQIEMPLETAAYKPTLGADLANAQCLTCHSAEYVSTQPPMPRAFWKGSIDKMIGKYGAPIPPEQVELLADYFAKNYGIHDTNATPASAPEKGTSTAATADAKQVMQKGGCFNCHTVDRKLIGPAFKDVAGKYKGNPDAFANVTRQITHGGSGLWGPIPMPPFKQFSENEVKMLVDWILAQK